MSQFKHNILKVNLHISEWINNISIAGETYSSFVIHKFKIYSTLSWSIFKYYMETRMSDWEEGNYFAVEQLRVMSLKKYNKLLTSARWSNKYT